MQMLHSKLPFLILLTCFVYGVKAQDQPKREMRAVWIATVENIDWPSSPRLSTEAQMAEMTGLLDLVKAYHLNTVVLQIRPAADAFYPSSLEPWSHWLTGEQGRAPDPLYDPLEFVIRECRERGLDIHVWINPYRAIRDTALYKASPGHITQLHPEWFLTYGNTMYFDPGLPETRDHVARVVSDIVRRYDIDAIHMDDYFYPYRIAGIPFPDDRSFTLYREASGDTLRDVWRRNNVDKIIQQLHDSILRIKPWVAFGISPFGVWRNASKDPAGSDTRAGQTNFDDLFADVLKWQKEGWIDYVVPQLYWHIGFDAADYAILAAWWSRNSYGCPLYIGQAFYRIDRKSPVKAWRSSREIVRQIKLNRSLPEIGGSMFFSAKYLRSNPMKLKKRLVRQVYPLPALPPVNQHIPAVLPEAPANLRLLQTDGRLWLSWEKGANTKNFIVYRFRNGKPMDLSSPRSIFRVTPETSVEIAIQSRTRPSPFKYVVTSQSITNTESEPAFFNP